jgi:5'-3' exonuclease
LKKSRRMGIRNFFTYLNTNFPEAISLDIKFENLRGFQSNVDHLCIDVNPLIWIIAKMKISGPEQFYTHFYQYLKLIMKTFKPKKSVYLALDGVGITSIVKT